VTTWQRCLANIIQTLSLC